ncbi:MAG: NADPH-dependent 7-cyano-7-deazaguanine reductase QueF [Gammaproteobacteria bacterium]|jgi:7-cyano-7-deazaguanine reductase|nr:NADPH-dependent 7-cyano-7-deazaguanine reductase QueF [Gammaproteobacteria bacterium]MBT5541931.1 NADPH-dependent 7-cyano-7-deazaguanine reductase QueF [Gammaproteobacteria bacterium]MBT6074376.1 NADPH-dependent 7-cyano-7-deazaguanine reductase QueF [Gammaproteobacteria bacterium]MBT7753012.1 NADPH-dependent 7-cyano-7-deazaguanine reductase QueF [Gammaproteobacteria bacterium]MDG2434425.1 preQ(1) synthase [Gammaproteobacteria bacterium]
MNDQLNILESFDNPNINKDYLIKIEVPEFTCLCPKTGQPDFAIVFIKYIPRDLCIELKSLKLYMGSYRDIGSFHEAITNKICDDLVNIMLPNYIEVKVKFNVRGGIYTEVQCTNINENWTDKLNLINPSS